MAGPVALACAPAAAGAVLWWTKTGVDEQAEDDAASPLLCTGCAGGVGLPRPWSDPDFGGLTIGFGGTSRRNRGTGIGTTAGDNCRCQGLRVAGGR